MDERFQKELAQLLQETMSGEDLVSLARSICCEDGTFDEFDTMDFEDAADIAGSAYEFGRSIVYGNVSNVMDQVRYDAYGNLESVSDYQLEHDIIERLDELAQWLLSNDISWFEDDMSEEVLAFARKHGKWE